MTGLLRKTLVTGLILVVSTGAALAEVIKPFVLAGTSGGDVASVSAEVKSKLTAGGFEVVGEYSPYADTNIIIVTNDAQKGHAAKSEFGGYGAISRVSVTKNGDNTEVVYTNPVYMAAAYRMAVDMADIRASLESALGAQQDFGTGDKQLTADDMRKYHYTVMME